MSQLFSQTMRENPAEAEVASHQLLLRAGYIRPLAAGIFNYLPLAKRALDKIETIMRQEIEAIGGQEISMPVVHPADLWKESGRWYQIGSEMGRFKDKDNRDMVLSMTHEEVIADLVRKNVRSYRQLPLLLFHIQTKWRDDPRPRAGLIRAREFIMKDSYSLDRDAEGLEKQYRAHYQAYFNIFTRCGLDVITGKADLGIMGGQMAHEFIYLTPIGEDTIMICPECGYAANRQIANFSKLKVENEILLPIDEIATPNCKSIDALAELLKIPKSRTAKAVFFVASIKTNDEMLTRFIFAIVRGDMEVNEVKLGNALQAHELHSATEEEILAIGATPGFASPVGLPADGRVIIIVDEAIPVSPNLVAGANRDNYHWKNVNYGRDFQADIVADIVTARAGDACPSCQASLQEQRGVEVGHIFKLGIYYTERMRCTYVDEEGISQPVLMGSYGIGCGRLLACIAESHHDEQGLIWPITVAPFQVHLVVLGGKNQKQKASDFNGISSTPEVLAEALYQDLLKKGVEVLFDDRVESPGVKFNDADLLGLPIRLTVSERSVKNSTVEIKRRDLTDRTTVPISTVVATVLKEIDCLRHLIQKRVRSVDYLEY